MIETRMPAKFNSKREEKKLFRSLQSIVEMFRIHFWGEEGYAYGRTEKV